MTLAKRIIPCLDIDRGRVVKGTRFLQLRDAGDPVDVARLYGQEGADEICVLDISATSDDRQPSLDILTRIAESVFVPLTFGGGIGSIAECGQALSAGADKVSINSAALRKPSLIDETVRVFGSQCIVVAIDTRLEEGRYLAYTHGGRNSTGIDALEWARQAVDRGAGELLITSMDRDGTGLGYDLKFLEAVSSCVSVPVIASGGVGELKHFAEGAAVADAMLVAGVLHFGTMTLAEIRQYLRSEGVTVRDLYTDR